jgi:quercetin dioxygenase-like cupin family protein
MHLVARKDLPFRGMSHEFIGADQGGVAVSVYLTDTLPGRAVRRHRHPYDEIVFVQEGWGRWTVEGEEREAGPGDILVVKAGQAHGFVNPGEGRLVHLDIHLSERFQQENLE